VSETPRPDAGLAVAARPPLGLILLLGSLTALGPLAIDMYLPALPSIARSFEASPAAAQQTMAVFLFGLAVGQLAYGPLSDRWGRRGPMLFGLGLYLAGSLGCMLAPSIEALSAFRVLQALGACGGMVLSRAVIRDRFPPAEILHVMSMLMLVMGLAPILAPMLGGWILLVGDWRMIFGFQAAAGLVLAVCILLVLKESRSEATAALARTENPLRSYVALLRNRLIVAYVLSGAFSGAALFAYVASSPDVLIVQNNVPPEHFGWIFGLNAAGVIAGVQVNARLARRWPSDLILRRALVIGCGFSLLLVLAAATEFGGLIGLLVPLALVIGAYGFTQSNAQTEAMKLDGLRAGSTAALLGSGTFAAGAGGAALTSVFANGTAVPMAAVIALSFLGGLVALATLAPRAKRPPA
jgi:DHA1 family bicyclomycin/chloramphenicol resistance-like MFS transporter